MSAIDDPNAAEAALRWFVRARAPDFGAAEQRELADWLAAAPEHRSEWIRLEGTWRTLDQLARPVRGLRPFPDSPAPSRRRRGLLAAGALGLACIVAALLLPGAPTHYRTAPAEYLTLAPAPGVNLRLNADSAATVLARHPLRIQLERGDLHFDIAPPAEAGLEVTVGGFAIRDIGTRFAVGRSGDGGWVAVARGAVEVRRGGVSHPVGAGRRADFSDDGRIAESPVAENDVAPWRTGRWHFDAAPLSEIAGELARQHGIQLDLADPGLAFLTVSGRFDIADPHAMLWAVSQVHGLRLSRPGEKHYSLARE